MVSRRPRAVGLVSVPLDSTPTARTWHRIRLALFADEAGFSLVETFDVDGRPVRDEIAFRQARRVASDVGATVLIVSGNVSRARIGDVARAAGLFIRAVPNGVMPTG